MGFFLLTSCGIKNFTTESLKANSQLIETKDPVPAPSPVTPIAVVEPVASKVVTVNSGIFSVSGYVTKATVAAGQIQTARVSITADSAISSLIVGIKYLDANGNFLFEKAQSEVNFVAGQAKSFSLDFALRGDAPAGTYTIAVGIWSANYASTVLYQSNIPSYQVSSILLIPKINSPMPVNNLNMISGVDEFLYSGAYFVQNNMWGIQGLPAGSYYENSGIGPLTSGNSISARWNWQFPNGPNEVKGYPAIGFGQKPGQYSTPGSGLPKQVDSIKSATSSWDTQAAYTGKGQLTFDLWLTRDGAKYSNFPNTPITHEIMLTVDSFGGYGESRNPGWYFSSTIIDGITYRVWKADNFGLGWRFIVLQMVNPTSMIKGSINFKNIFVYLKSAGLITGQEYLSSIEFGNEMEEGTGDVLVKDFKAEVR